MSANVFLKLDRSFLEEIFGDEGATIFVSFLLTLADLILTTPMLRTHVTGWEAAEEEGLGRTLLQMYIQCALVPLPVYTVPGLREIG